MRCWRWRCTNFNNAVVTCVRDYHITIAVHSNSPRIRQSFAHSPTYNGRDDARGAYSTNTVVAGVSDIYTTVRAHRHSFWRVQSRASAGSTVASETTRTKNSRECCSYCCVCSGTGKSPNTVIISISNEDIVIAIKS